MFSFFRKKILVLLLAGTLFFALAGAGEATVANKNIKATYSNIKISLNGQQVVIPAEQEPFLYNWTTYVPLRLVSQALNCNVTWNEATKTVVITTKESPEVANLKLQLTQKDNQIQLLQQEINSLKNKSNSSSSSSKDDDDIDDLEDDLNADYDELEDVEIDDITLDGDEDDVEVTIEVDLGDYDDEWSDLTDRDIEDWLEDLVEDIQDEFSDDTYVEGEIIDIDEDDVLVTFEKDGDDDLEVKFRDGDYRDDKDTSDVNDVMDDLEDDNYSIDGEDFTLKLSYTASSERLMVRLYADDDLPSSFDIDEDDLEDICDDIAATFEDEDIDLEIMVVYVYDDGSSTPLDSFDYDLDDGTLD